MRVRGLKGFGAFGASRVMRGVDAASGARSSQPRSSKWYNVRSTSSERPDVAEGSMSRLGVALTSQCEMDEPVASVKGA